MPRQKGYKLPPAAKKRIAAARRGRKWDAVTKAKIGAGVRKGASNKVAFMTRVDPEILARFKAAVKARNETQAGAVEQAMESWVGARKA